MPTNYVSKIKISIAENTDDGREQNSATWNSQGNSGNIITIGNSGGSVYSAGLRFRNLLIPYGAKVFLARLKLRPAVTDLVDPDVRLIIKGVKEINTKPFSSTSRPSQRAKTVNSVPWHIIKKWQVHEWTQTPNLNLIIEEIVGQNGWKPGNALALAIEDNGSATDQAQSFFDSSKGKGYEAQLEVWFLDSTANITIGTLAGTDRDGVELDKTSWQNSPAGNVITIGHDGLSANDAGFIFSSINIPRRSHILSACLLLTQADQNNRFPHLRIRGFAEDNSDPFASDGSNRPSLRPKTSAEVEWTIGHQETGVFVGEHWSAESVYESPELKEIVQEIVDRENWQSGNRIGLALENWSSWSGQYKLPWDYVKNSGEYAAKLAIAWRSKRTIATSQKDVEKWDKNNYPEYIIVHHSATPRDGTRFQTIKNNHIGIGWGDIAYHHWISGALDGNGVHIPGRPENKIGAHTDTQKMNYRSIGIVVCGDFQPTSGNEQPTAEQLNTLQSLLDQIRKDRGIPRERVLGHREAPDATNCPGDNLLAYIQRYRATGKLL